MDGGVGLARDDERNAFVQVPERSRESSLTQAPDASHEGVVKGGEDPAGRGPVLRDAPQLVELLRDPRVHEAAKRLFHRFLGVSIHRRTYGERQTSTSSKYSPARRPVLRFTWRVIRSSRTKPAFFRIVG